MTIFASKANQAFYDDRLNLTIPDDAVEISKELHDELINAPSYGNMIAWGDDGFPYSTKFALTPEQQAIEARAWRSAELLKTDGPVARHRDEVEEGVATTLSVAQYAELQSYRRVLRDWPASEGFPAENTKPAPPVWLEYSV